jgi:hypothetical protein
MGAARTVPVRRERQHMLKSRVSEFVLPAVLLFASVLVRLADAFYF